MKKLKYITVVFEDNEGEPKGFDVGLSIDFDSSVANELIELAGETIVTLLRKGKAGVLGA
jgi:hypothetical protein